MPQRWKPINILFRNDDPCALSNADHERCYLNIFARYRVPQVASVIPFVTEDPHNSRGTRFHELAENGALIETLKTFHAHGLVEIAQHGTTHQTNHLHPSQEQAAAGSYYQGIDRKWSAYAPQEPVKGYSEFNGLERSFIRKEMRRGKDYLEQIFAGEVNTFTFPWGTQDANALHALEEAGFQTALCGGKDIYFINKLMTIYNPREDILEFSREFEKIQLPHPVLYHVVLHSWMLSEQDLAALDALLGRLASDERVGFVTAGDLRQWPKDFQLALASNHRLRRWGRIANRHLGSPVQLPQRYDLSLRKFDKQIMKSFLVALIFDKIGLNRFWAFSGAFFVIALWLSAQELAVVTWMYRILLICSGGLFAVLSTYKFKNRFLHALSKKKQNYHEIARQAFSHPQDRFIVALFFGLFEQQRNHPPEDFEKYLQLKYFHGAKPWAMLNELARGYEQRGLTALAQMCCTESLRLNASQSKIFQKLNALDDGNQLPKASFPPDTCAISVIVCTNREPRELKSCLRSILANTFQDFEIIVFNHNGPPEIQQVAESFGDPRIIYHKVDRDLGIPGGRNAAVQLARGKYIAYLDDDDVFYPDHLELLYKTAIAGDHRFVYAKTRGVLGYLQGGDFIPVEVVFNWGSEFDRERFASQASLGNHAVLHEKSLFADLGLFKEGLIVSEEEDFYLRCAAAMELKYVARNTSEYRIKGTNSVIVNAIRNQFMGAIVRQYHAAFQGELARLKYFVNRRDRQAAQVSLNKIRAQYLAGYFKSAFVLDELWPLVKYCGDREFLRAVIADFYRLYHKECLKSLAKRGALHLLPSGGMINGTKTKSKSTN